MENKDILSSVSNVAYCEPCLDHRWQGDVYASEDFPNGPPKQGPSYWMIVNRTCHMVEGQGREVKLPHLVYCGVFDIEYIIDRSGRGQNIKNQIKNIVSGKSEHLGFLPENPERQVSSPLVANFNMLQTLSLDNCPDAGKKRLQLTSPFCEYLMQRFSRWFYTVSIDDAKFRDPSYISLIEKKFDK